MIELSVRGIFQKESIFILDILMDKINISSFMFCSVAARPLPARRSVICFQRKLFFNQRNRSSLLLVLVRAQYITCLVCSLYPDPDVDMSHCVTKYANRLNKFNNNFKPFKQF